MGNSTHIIWREWVEFDSVDAVTYICKRNGEYLVSFVRRVSAYPLGVTILTNNSSVGLLVSTDRIRMCVFNLNHLN